MNILALLVMVLPRIVELMKVAEVSFGDKPKSGEQKKDLVMQATGIIVNGLSDTLTGGAADTWSLIKEPVSQIIDASAKIAFPHPGEGLFGGGH